MIRVSAYAAALFLSFASPALACGVGPVRDLYFVGPDEDAHRIGFRSHTDLVKTEFAGWMCDITIKPTRMTCAKEGKKQTFEGKVHSLERCMNANLRIEWSGRDAQADWAKVDALRLAKH